MIIHEIWRLELGSNRTKSNLPSDFKQGWTLNIEIYGNSLIIFRGHQNIARFLKFSTFLSDFGHTPFARNKMLAILGVGDLTQIPNSYYHAYSQFIRAGTVLPLPFLHFLAEYYLSFFHSCNNNKNFLKFQHFQRIGINKIPMYNKQQHNP